MDPSRTTLQITSQKFITQINQTTSQVQAINGCRSPRRLAIRTKSSAVAMDPAERRVCSWDPRHRLAPFSNHAKDQSPAAPTQGRVRSCRKRRISSWPGRGRELRPNICTWHRCRVENSETWAIATTVLRRNPHCRAQACFIIRHRHRTSTGSIKGGTAVEATVGRVVKINTAYNSSRSRSFWSFFLGIKQSWQMKFF